MVLSCFRCSGSTSPAAAFQDKRFGTGKRVHNETGKRMASKVIYRCTICESERTKGQ